MPELPEVESLRRSLEPHLLGRRVVACSLFRRDVLVAPGDPAGGFSRSTRGRKVAPAPVANTDLLIDSTIAELRRHGKQLAIIGKDRSGRSSALVVQLGMTGTLLTGSSSSAPRTAHTHAFWTLDPDASLGFTDPRRFGGLRVFRSLNDLDEHWSQLGPDALQISGEHLALALRASARCVKAALLDQTVLAGVGNIYADESLFLAGIRPQTRCQRIALAQWATLAQHIRGVLSEAVNAGGSTLRDYVDANGAQGRYQGQHRVYGRQGEPCVRCGSGLRSRLLAQRMTVWCPVCQR